jgi:hypothetical protein
LKHVQNSERRGDAFLDHHHDALRSPVVASVVPTNCRARGGHRQQSAHAPCRASGRASSPEGFPLFREQAVILMHPYGMDAGRAERPSGTPSGHRLSFGVAAPA